MDINKLSVAAVLLATSLTAQAGIIVGGSTLVDTGGLARLEEWLDHGEVTLTNVFTKTGTATAASFHAAVDGKGATFVLMSASEDGGESWKTIGGYAPSSWNVQLNTYNITPNAADWTAFIFNLTDSVIKRQSQSYETYNDWTYGPTFGGGHDIYVNSSLSFGYSYGYSYGAPNARSIVDGSSYDGLNMQIGALEVFTIGAFIPDVSENVVPEPATTALAGLGLLGLAALRRRKRCVFVRSTMACSD